MGNQMAKRHPGRILNHGSGKGDKDRTVNTTAFKENFGSINWSPSPFAREPESPTEIIVNEKGRFVKRYGPKAPSASERGPSIKVL